MKSVENALAPRKTPLMLAALVSLIAAIGPAQAATQEKVHQLIQCAETAKSGTTLNVKPGSKSKYVMTRLVTKDQPPVEMMTEAKAPRSAGITFKDKGMLYVDDNSDGVLDYVASSTPEVALLPGERLPEARANFDTFVSKIIEACRANVPYVDKKKKQK